MSDLICGGFPTWGILGAAAATLSSDTLGIFCFGKMPEYRFLCSSILKILPACLVLAGGLYGGIKLHWSVFALAPLGGILYAVMLWATGGARQEDFRFLFGLLKGSSKPL